MQRIRALFGDSENFAEHLIVMGSTLWALISLRVSAWLVFSPGQPKSESSIGTGVKMANWLAYALLIFVLVPLVAAVTGALLFGTGWILFNAYRILRIMCCTDVPETDVSQNSSLSCFYYYRLTHKSAQKEAVVPSMSEAGESSSDLSLPTMAEDSEDSRDPTPWYRYNGYRPMWGTGIV